MTALKLVAQLTTCDAATHIVLADNKVGLQCLDIGQGILDIVVDMEVIDLAQVGTHKLQEFAVVVDEYHDELLRLSLSMQRLDVE